jgi:hypothetical protein
MWTCHPPNRMNHPVRKRMILWRRCYKVPKSNQQLQQPIDSNNALLSYIVSWKNPTITAISLYFFVRLVMVFDLAYIGSFPVFLLILWMLYLAAVRCYCKLKQKFIQKEIEASRKVRFMLLLFSSWKRRVLTIL